MADGVPITAGTGTTIATDDVSTVHYQQVKLTDGTLNATTPIKAGGGVEADALRVTIASDSTGVVSVDDNGGSLTVDGTVAVSTLGTITPGTAATSLGKAEDAGHSTGDVGVMALTVRQDTAAALGGTDADYQPLITDSTGRLHVNVGNTVTVGSHAVTNAGTFAVQVDGAALTALQLIDDPVATLGTTTYTETTTKGMIVGAVRRDADTTLVDTTNEVGPLQMDANGRLKVEVFSGETLPISLSTLPVTNAGTFVVQENGAALTALQLIDDIVYTDDTSTHATGTSKGALIMAAAVPTDTSVNANDIAAVAMTTDRKLHVSVQDSLPAGTAAIGKLASNTGVTIGAVEIAAAQTLATVTTVSTVTSVTALGTITPGTAATSLGKAEDAGHTTADVGVFVLGVRNDTPNTALTNTDADYSPISVNKLGSVRLAPPEDDFAVAGSNHVKKYYTNAGAVTDGIVWSPAAGKRWYITSIFINVSAAATVTLEDDLAGGDSAVWKAELAANSGWSSTFPVPWFSGEDAADLIVTTSAGNVYITVVGYEI